MGKRTVAITGPNGRLGRAIRREIGDHPSLRCLAWGRPDYDLDDPAAGPRLVDRDQPSVVVHTAAMTDVDACAREPDLARRRNGEAVGALAAACTAGGVDLILVSTNEVFDGQRTDHEGYTVEDEPRPINPYGASKFEGERLAMASSAKAPSGCRLAIVRTSWLFGPPGNDFPTKILAAARTADARGEPLRVVDDEFGSPTAAADLARAIVALIEADVPVGIHHCVGGGWTSRFAWAEVIVRSAGHRIDVEPIPSSTWMRPSTPPAWGVLSPSPLPGGLQLPTWQAATEAYVATIGDAG